MPFLSSNAGSSSLPFQLFATGQVGVLVVPTNEELMVARHALRLLGGGSA